MPLWGLFIAVLVVALLSVEAGFRLGRYRRQRQKNEQEAPVIDIVTAILGLLAFMLAFTFNMAESRFETRRLLVLDEANAIGTTYLRAGFLPEPQGPAIRRLLREYVTVRVTAVQTGKITEGVAQSEALQARIWSEAVSLAQKTTGSIMSGLFIQSLNDVIDLHAKRMTAGRNRLPRSIWVGLSFVSILAMLAVGYHAGLDGRRSPIPVSVLVLAFSAVIVLIADLDRPREGLIRVSQQALIDLQQEITAPEP